MASEVSVHGRLDPLLWALARLNITSGRKKQSKTDHLMATRKSRERMCMLVFFLLSSLITSGVTAYSIQISPIPAPANPL
jgi:hypothetical protein